MGRVFVLTNYEGKQSYGILHVRLPRDDKKRVAYLREAKDAFLVGAFWLKPDMETFSYGLLSIARSYFKKKQTRTLRAMIRKLMEVEFALSGAYGSTVRLSERGGAYMDRRTTISQLDAALEEWE